MNSVFKDYARKDPYFGYCHNNRSRTSTKLVYGVAQPEYWASIPPTVDHTLVTINVFSYNSQASHTSS